ncbi:MAG TPA: hypothetical protein VE907_21555 [Gammaproteobacteria bacterium]|nr:hypothetical protein [Gammaproteobacteria bacterium]
MRFLIALVALWSFTQSAQALEVWLASSPDTCNSCEIYRQVAQQRGYGRALRYADGAGLTIPILSIFKGVLASDVVAQLPAELGPTSATWDTTLLVLVVEAGRVLAAGNIADSADNNELRRSRAVMFPPAEPADDDPALHDDDFYAAFFASHWNLEYFVDVALGKRPARAPSRPVDLASTMPAELGASNVILWGSAGIPAANSLYIPTRMGEIRAELERMRLGSVRYVTLFGHGPGVAGNDTSYSDGGRTLFKRSELRADYAADAAGLNAVLTAQRRAERARTLLVQVGHSGPAGSPLWGHGLTLAPADVEPIKRESGGELVMVSGACNGGMFATAVQCGFFAAHPDVTASGCQLSPAALAKSDDYLRHFFGALSAPTSIAPTGRRRGAAPPVTFYDAHWYASTRLEDHQLSYTTTDALIDDYFAAHPDELSPATTVAEIQLAARNLTAAEAKAAADLTAGLLPEMAIPLTGYVEANHEAEQKLRDARELPSEERNRIVALPYKLELAMLARRIAYVALHVDDPAYALATSCERRTLQQLFGGK